MKRFILILFSVILAFGSLSVYAAPSVRVSTPEPAQNNQSESKKSSSDTSSEKSKDDSKTKTASDSKSSDENKSAESSPTPAPTPASPIDALNSALLCESAILIDGKTGAVLFEKNANNRMYPASTTKIATAMVALDAVAAGEIGLDDIVTTYREDIESLPADSSVLGLIDGEEMPLRDLLNGLLVASGNDAAAVIARYVSGSQEAFVERMNELLAKVGAENSHFENSHGLHSENHYTTASDMAKLAKYAMQNNEFRNFVSNAHIYLPVTNKSDRRYFINTNNLISRMKFTDYYYDKAIGIKTGSTEQAGHCLVAGAARGERELISVVFKAEDIPQSHTSSKALLEYGFTNFTSYRVAKLGDIISEVKIKYAAGGVDHIPLVSQTAIDVTLPKGANKEDIEISINIPDYVAAPVEIDQVIGSVSYTYNGKTLSTVALVSDATVPKHMFGFIMEGFDFIWSFMAVKIIVYAILAAALVLIIIFLTGLFRAAGRRNNRSSSYRPPTYYKK